MHVAGVDYSTSCPGVTVKAIGHDLYDFHFMTEVEKYQVWSEGPFYTINGDCRPEHDGNSLKKYRDQAEWAARLVRHCRLVVLEDYAYGARGRAFHIGECTGLFKAALYGWGVPYEVVSPTAIKKFATGRGNADKEGMWQAFIESSGIDLVGALGYDKRGIESPVADVVDSYFISRYAEELL